MGEHLFLNTKNCPDNGSITKPPHTRYDESCSISHKLWPTYTFSIMFYRTNESWSEARAHRRCLTYKNLFSSYLGPAENGTNWNAGIFAMLSFENLSGLNSMWSLPHMLSMWLRTQIFICTMIPLGNTLSPIRNSSLVSRFSMGTGQWSLIPSLMHIVRHSNWDRSDLQHSFKR